MKQKTKIDPETGDKRKLSGGANLAKARAARLARIAAVKEAAKNQYEVVSSEDDEIVDIILTKKKKNIINKDEERMLKLELMLEKLMLQEKMKNEKPSKKVISINLTPPTPLPVKHEMTPTMKKYLLDL